MCCFSSLEFLVRPRISFALSQSAAAAAVNKTNYKLGSFGRKEITVSSWAKFCPFSRGSGNALIFKEVSAIEVTTETNDELISD